MLLGLTSAMVLLVYSLNTWLPQLMLRQGIDTKGLLAFLLVLNLGAVLAPARALGSPTSSAPKSECLNTLLRSEHHDSSAAAAASRCHV